MTLRSVALILGQSRALECSVSASKARWTGVWRGTDEVFLDPELKVPCFQCESTSNGPSGRRGVPPRAPVSTGRVPASSASNRPLSLEARAGFI